jgi:hypothetical protein
MDEEKRGNGKELDTWLKRRLKRRVNVSTKRSERLDNKREEGWEMGRQERRDKRGEYRRQK